MDHIHQRPLLKLKDEGMPFKPLYSETLPTCTGWGHVITGWQMTCLQTLRGGAGSHLNVEETEVYHSCFQRENTTSDFLSEL